MLDVGEPHIEAFFEFLASLRLKTVAFNLLLVALSLQARALGASLFIRIRALGVKAFALGTSLLFRTLALRSSLLFRTCAFGILARALRSLFSSPFSFESVALRPPLRIETVAFIHTHDQRFYVHGDCRDVRLRPAFLGCQTCFDLFA
ncbi:hypothetical protein CR152_13475 [Massilia violaceinigra]|uniref:Uncharacterized protein n=1 Tax=Massilia violaceinigra TaxID=2045208 RepID=A0A2D2DKC2_9BURK|nr:hypothetical protein CR152_13475 [Massilia violaceinigra]